MGFEIQIGGVPVWISAWSLLLVLLIALDANIYIKRMFTCSNRNLYFFAALAAAFITLASVFLHEVAHAVAAKFFGITIVEAGIGAVYAYVSPDTPISQVSPLAEIVISAVGPLTNFLLAGILALPVWLLKESLVENTLQYGSFTNIQLGKLNLIPIFAFDGGKITHGILWWLTGSSDKAAILSFLVTSVTIIVLVFFRKKRGKKLEDRLQTL